MDAIALARRCLPLVAAVGAVLLVRYTGLYSWVGRQPFGDKLAHFFLIGSVAFCLDHALGGRLVGMGRFRVRLGLLIVAVGMTLEEVSQIWLPDRTFEAGDLAANYAGIVMAGLIAHWRDRIARPHPGQPAPMRLG